MSFARTLTVVTPAASTALLTLDTIKQELGLSDSSTDALLTRWISECSAQIAAYTERVWGAEEVIEQLRQAVHTIQLGDGDNDTHARLRLTRWPVTAIVSIVEDDDVALVAGTDFELDAATGIVTRLFSDLPFPWRRRRTVIRYQAGYTLPDEAPSVLQQACQALVKGRWGERTRDPALRSFLIPGVIEKTFWVPQAGSSNLPPEVAALLDPLCDRDL